MVSAIVALALKAGMTTETREYPFTSPVTLKAG
jgi:hypothetical protein